MCFRLKTIFGIALIEGVILLVLVWSSLNYLTQSNQEELTKRAETTTRLFAAMTKNPVLSSDLATLDAVVTEMMQSPGVVYVRILDNDRVLAEEGALDALSRPFERDELFEQSADGIFDIDAEIMEGDYKFGRVELGLSVAPLNTLVDEARDRLLSIAALEMVLVAVFSFFFGTYLSRSLIRLAKGAEAIADGKLGTQVAVEDCAEIRTAAIAFNTMSQRLQHSHEEMQRSLADSQALAEQLTQSELRLKTTLDTAINGFITIDQSGIIQSINRVGQEIFGYQEPELIGRNVSCLMPTPYRDEHDGYLKRYLDGGQARVIGIGREALGLRKDGSEFPLSLRVSEMRIGDERMFVGLVSDLSEKRSMEKAISRSTAINSAIMAASLDALITVDDTGAIIDFSPVAEQTFGFQRDEVLGWSISEVIIPPAQRKLHNKWIQRYLRTGQEQVQRRRIEVNAMRRNGEEFPVELTIIPIELDGEVLCTAFVRDISEQKAAENQLREAKRQAEAASEAKSRFLAHMSHEIRSPLNAVLGSVGLLIETTLDENQHLYAHTAETSGKALLGLINDVLDFSKIEAGQLTLEQVKFNLRDLVAGVDEAVGYRVKDKQGLDIISTLGHGIPAQLMGDPGRLRQILLNLMDNAAKFTEQGAVLLRVTALGKNGDRTVLRFEVQDTGIGISKEAQRRLFSEFSQVDNSDSTRYGGTGLGLAICQQLVELMGGHIGLESQPGRGSCFWFEVPFLRVKGDSSEAVPREIKPCRVLVVGLMGLVRDALCQQLEALGCDTATVAEGQAALDAIIDAKAGNTPFDYILIDEKLTETNPALLAQRLRSECSAELVLISHALAVAEAPLQHKKGYDHVIFRPIHLDALLGAMRSLTSTTTASVQAQQVPCVVSSQRQGLRLLLAEDSPANQMVATALLRGAGYQVDVAANGREAVEAFQREGYDLILMDMRMPEMDGIEATEVIRAAGLAGQQIPILAMSANALQSDIDRCLAAGMNDYVTKPVVKENLLDAIQSALGGKSGHSPQESKPMFDNNQPILEEDVLTHLANDTSPEQVPLMLNVFLEEGEARTANISKALQGGDLSVLREEAHVLKSLSGTFGAARLQVVARALEQMCRNGENEQAVVLAEQLIDVFAETEKVFQTHINGVKA